MELTETGEGGGGEGRLTLTSFYGSAPVSFAVWRKIIVIGQHHVKCGLDSN